jgi:hypothetical protein
MCPSIDRTKAVTDDSSTFLVTKMIPPAPTDDQQTLANQETYCRTLANSGNELYIFSGGHGNSGFIANGRVGIPTTRKVIIMLPAGTNDVSRVTTATRLIAVSVPNKQLGRQRLTAVSRARRSGRTSDRLRFLFERCGFDSIGHRIESSTTSLSRIRKRVPVKPRSKKTKLRRTALTRSKKQQSGKVKI